jgi:ribosomal protein S18 acetylase RimI-like enzyme
VASLRFEPIDIVRHGDVCVLFRRDSFVCSFGEGRAFEDEPGGVPGYLEWLKGRLAAFPAGAVHAWRGDRIVGQIEAQIRPAPTGAYVNLFYLVPDERGTGAADKLHDFAVSLFKSHDAITARLSVSPTNARALRYYAKHGWRDLGVRPDHPEVHLMELVIAPM